MQFNEQNFKEEVLNFPGVVAVDFFATWCGPCRMQAPIIEEVAKELTGVAKVGKLDVDESQGVAADYQITSIPTIVIFKNGQPVERYSGLQAKESLISNIKKHL